MLNSFFKFSPGPADASSGPPPPVVDVLDVAGVLLELGVVQHGADPAKELGVDEFTGALKKKLVNPKNTKTLSKTGINFINAKSQHLKRQIMARKLR